MIKPNVEETNNTAYLRAEELFTDREEPRKAFWDIYNSIEKGCSDVITYYGMGGIGKSSLLKQLCYEIKENTPKKEMPNFAFCSFEGNVSKEEFLFSLSRQMMLYDKKLRFPLFDAAFTRIAATDGKDLKRFEETARKSFADNELVDIAINIGGQFITGLEPATKIVKAICSFASARKYKKELEKGPNSQLYFTVMSAQGKEIRSGYLHECFKRDVKAFLAEMEQPYVVFIDGYENYVSLLKNENYADDKDDWFRETLVKELPNVLWVIAGREKLNWDEELLPSDQQHRVGDLSQKDTAEFFKKNNIVDEELVEQLYKLTNGTPAYLDLCVQPYKKIVATRKPTIDDFGKNTSDLVERYLENMSDSDKKIMIMLSFFPKVWDIHMAEEIARALGYEGYIDNIYKLVKLSLFERAENGFKLHETFRSVVKNAHKDRQERIGTTIIQYLTQVLLKSRTSMDYMHRCMQFVEVFELCEKKVVSDVDMNEILYAVLEEVQLSVSYANGEYIFATLENSLEKKGYPFVFVLDCIFCRVLILHILGRYNEALELAKTTIVSAEQTLNVDSSYLIKFNHIIGAVYLDIGEYHDALEYIIKAYSLARDKMCENGEILGMIMSDIAMVYNGLGQHATAKKMLDQVYENMKDINGEDDIVTVEILNKFASVCFGVGDYEKAKEMAEKAYEQKVCYWGYGHIETMAELYNVARLHRVLGEYEIAKEKLLIVYDTYIKAKGDMNLTVATVLDEIALIYSSLKQHKKAIETYMQSYKINKKTLGENNQNTVLVLHKIADEYKEMGEYIQAKKIYEQVLEQCKDKVGEEPLKVSLAIFDLGEVCMVLGEYEAAEKYYEKTYEIQKDLLEEDNLLIVATLNQWAMLLFNTKEYEKSKSLLIKMYDVYKNKNDEESYVFASRLLFYMAKASIFLGEYDEAKTQCEQLYKRMKEYLGEENQNTFDIANDLAYIYMNLGEYENVIKLYEPTYDKVKAILGEEHSYILAALYNIATAYGCLEKYKKSKELFEELYGIVSTMPEQKEFAASVAELIEDLNKNIEK